MLVECGICCCNLLRDERVCQANISAIKQQTLAGFLADFQLQSLSVRCAMSCSEHDTDDNNGWRAAQGKKEALPENDAKHAVRLE